MKSSKHNTAKTERDEGETIITRTRGYGQGGPKDTAAEIWGLEKALTCISLKANLELDGL